MSAGLFATLSVALPSVASPEGERDRATPATPVAVLNAVSAVSASDAWAVGAIGPNGDRALAEHWDGSAWTVVPTPNPGFGFDDLRGVVALSPTDAWAVGYYNQKVSGVRYRTLVLHWDGGSWTQVASPNADDDAVLTAVSAVSPTDLWAVGYSMEQVKHGYHYATLTMHWDGMKWTIVASPNLDTPEGTWLASVSAAATDDAWAVGSDPYVPAESIYLHWDGVSWTTITAPKGAKSGCLNGVSAIGSDVWAVSSREHKGLVEHWDGSSWRKQSMGPDGCLTGVSAATREDAWAVGFGPSCYPSDRGFAEHWDGAEWTSVTVPEPGHATSTALNAVDDRTPRDAWAVGFAVKVNRSTRPLIEHWDGTAWSIVKAPF